ncbi:hypothetical protein Q5P01_018690 [Channa striata]|uniref:Uncharacterized protein n=1 Tax=Channa striata TaxID=64152 RepID=A0AA88M598_CHASR|nr:hypothetical protein Q5P01_018690 [Channa striata]
MGSGDLAALGILRTVSDLTWSWRRRRSWSELPSIQGSCVTSAQATTLIFVSSPERVWTTSDRIRSQSLKTTGK